MSPDQENDPEVKRMSRENSNGNGQSQTTNADDRARFASALERKREAAHGDPDKLKLYDMVAKVGEKNPAAANRIFDLFDASPLAEGKFIAAIRAGTLEKIELMTPNQNGTGTLAEYNVIDKKILLSQTALEDKNPKTRDGNLLGLVQSAAHEGQHAVEGNNFKKAISEFDASINNEISRNPNGPRDHTQAVATVLKYGRTAEATGEIEGFNASAEMLKKKAEKDGKPFDLGYMYESFEAAGNTRMRLYMDKTPVAGQDGAYTYTMKKGIEIDENLQIKRGDASTVEAVAKNYFDTVASGPGQTASGVRGLKGYPENYTENWLNRIDYIERERGVNYPTGAQIIIDTSKLPVVVSEYVDRSRVRLNYRDPGLEGVNIQDRTNPNVVDPPAGKPATASIAAAPVDSAVNTTASNAQTNGRNPLLAQASNAIETSGIGKDLDPQQRSNLEAGVARLAQDNKLQQIAGIVQGANGQAVVYDGTSDHARRVGFDPNRLQQTPAEQSLAAVEQNTAKTTMVAQEVSNKAPSYRAA
jgi:hypothetical protein